MSCPSCGEPAEPTARFCENCGTALALTEANVAPAAEAADAPASGEVSTAAPPAGSCPNCGAADGYDADGFCLSCGVRPVRPRDHLEVDFGPFAAVSDKGPRKVRNEDAFALAPFDVGEGFVLSVCDGVSNIPRSDEASQGAADAAVAVLRGIGPGDAADAALHRAAAEASAAVTGLERAAVGGDPPSCTFLAAVWRPWEGVTVGWMGDCRLYVLTAAGVRRLTTDHSWGTEAVAAGQLTQAEADRDDRSHAITRWLGADAGVEPVPEIAHWTPSAGERAVLVACSDGAWNYLDSLDELAALVAASDPSFAPLAAARRITEHAIAGGGHDNITVVLADVVAATTAGLTPVSAPTPVTIPTEPS